MRDTGKAGRLVDVRGFAFVSLVIKPGCSLWKLRDVWTVKLETCEGQIDQTVTRTPATVPQARWSGFPAIAVRPLGVADMSGGT